MTIRELLIKMILSDAVLNPLCTAVTGQQNGRDFFENAFDVAQDAITDNQTLTEPAEFYTPLIEILKNKL